MWPSDIYDIYIGHVSQKYPEEHVKQREISNNGVKTLISSGYYLQYTE